THGLNTSDLTDRAQLTISGHFHHKDEKKFNNGTILYVGSAYQQDWGDYNTKRGLFLLDLNDLSYEFIENNVSPTYYKIVYSEIQNGELDSKSITGNVIKVIVDKEETGENIDKLLRRIASLKLFELTIDY